MRGSSSLRIEETCAEAQVSSMVDRFCGAKSSPTCDFLENKKEN